MLKFATMVIMPENDAKTLANLSLHSQRLSRQFERTVTQLRDLQKTRLDNEADELKDLLAIQDMYEAKGETYDHSADGFVFSQHQINDAIRARNREIRTDKAYAA